MVSKQNRRLLLLILKTLVLSGLLLGTYYQWWLKPRLALPRALAAAEQVLSARQANLLQSRLALMELLRLDPASASFEITQDNLLARLRIAQADGEKLLAQPVTMLPVKGYPTEQISFTATKLPDALNQLLGQHRAVLANQNALLDALSEFQDQVVKMYRYNPAVDLSDELDANAMIIRAQAAYDGLGAINEDIKAAGIPATERLALQAVITRSQDHLTVLIEAAKSGDSARIEAARLAFADHFTQVKTAVLVAQQSLITAHGTAANLTQHTNLLLAYNFWLVKINEQQAQMRR